MGKPKKRYTRSWQYHRSNGVSKLYPYGNRYFAYTVGIRDGIPDKYHTCLLFDSAIIYKSVSWQTFQRTHTCNLRYILFNISRLHFLETYISTWKISFLALGRYAQPADFRMANHCHSEGTKWPKELCTIDSSAKASEWRNCVILRSEASSGSYQFFENTSSV